MRERRPSKNVCRLSDKICPIGARDNDWLRLTGDDQRQVQSVRWSVAMRRFLLVAVMCGAASVAQAADMPDLPFLRGSFTDGLSSARVNWQGFYVGGQAATARSPSKVSPAPTAICKRRFCDQHGVDVQIWQWPNWPKAHSNATGFGAFVGYNSQWEDVVVGIEANYIHDGFRSASDSSAGRGTCRRPLVIRQPDPFERGREALRFRLAARPRRLRHGMLPAIRVRRHRLRQPRPSIAPFRAYPVIRLPPLDRTPAEQDQAGLWLQRRRSAST